MKTEIQNIASTLKRTFNKNAWHGPAVKEVLEGISAEQASSRVGNSHNIVELVAHMTAWRIFVLKKLEGDEHYKVADELNFPAGNDLQKAMAELEASQQQLLDAWPNSRRQSFMKPYPTVPTSTPTIPFFTGSSIMIFITWARSYC